MKEQTLDQEVRIRVLEEIAKDIKETMHRMNDKLDNQFKWTIGVNISLFATIITLFGGAILVKLV